MSFRQTYYHIVFGTKRRKEVIQESLEDEMFKYIWGIIKNKKCFLHRINAHKDHVHMLVDIHPTVCLSDFVKIIKTSSTIWIKEKKLFDGFDGWSDGYGAFTVGYSEKDKVISYIMNQKEHHRKKSFTDELVSLLKEHNIEFEEKYLL